MGREKKTNIWLLLKLLTRPLNTVVHISIASMLLEDTATHFSLFLIRFTRLTVI